jgi:hypothetical protein
VFRLCGIAVWPEAFDATLVADSAMLHSRSTNPQPDVGLMRSSHLSKLIALLLATFVLATSAAADSIPLRTMPPFKRSAKTCLSIHYDGDAAYWLNHCSYPVSVRWEDEAKCQNWSCQDEIPANARSAAAISRHARWCECPGALTTCNLPANGCQ